MYVYKYMYRRLKRMVAMTTVYGYMYRRLLYFSVQQTFKCHINNMSSYSKCVGVRTI